MPNYTLVPGLQKYGTGSLQVPYRAGTTGSDANLFVINAQSGNNFTIQANQDFIISFWAKYGDFNPNTNTSVLRRLFGYGGYGGSWSFGITSRNIGGAQQMLAYFEYNGNVMTTVYNASQTNNLGPAANGDWCKWTASRSGSTITFSFYRPDGSTINTNTQIYSGTIGENVFNPPNSDPWTRITVGPANYPDDGANNVVYIDEFYMARGISQPVNQDPQTLEVNDGKLATTAFLYHFNNSYADTNIQAQYGAAQLASQSAITIQAQRIVRIQAQITSTFAATTTAIKVTTQFQSTLTATTSMYALVTAVNAQATLASRFSVVVNNNKNYPRPNGTWDATINSQPTWVNWQDLYVSVTNPSITSYTTGSPGTNDFVWTKSFVVPYGNNTPSDLGFSYVGALTVQGEIVTTTFGVNKVIAIGYRSTVSTITISVEIINRGSSSRTSLLLLSYPNTFVSGGNTQTITLSRDGANVTLTSGGQTTQTSVSTLVETTAWSAIDINYFNGTGTYTWAASETILSIGNGATLIKRLDGKIYESGVGYTVDANPLDVVLTRNQTLKLFSLGTELASWTATNNNITSLSIPLGSNLLLTRTGFDYNSTVTSTNPYEVNNQLKILGLYDARGGVDRTGTLTPAQATLNPRFVTVINATRIVQFAVALNSTWVAVINATKTARTGRAFAISTTLTANVTRGIFAQSSISSQFATAVTARRIPGIIANISAATQITAQPYNFTKYTANIQSASSVVARPLRIKQFEARIQTSASELTAIGRIRTDLAIIDATTQLQAQATITARIAINMQATTRVTTPINRLRQGYSTQFVRSDIVVDNNRIKSPNADLTSQFAISINATKAIITSADLQAQTQLQALTLRSKTSTTSSVMNVRSAQTTQATSLKTAQVNLAISTSLFCSIFKVFRPTIHLYAGSFVMSVGRRIDIDPYTTLHIPQESRGLRILPESRIISIKEETRVNIIQGQDR